MILRPKPPVLLLCSSARQALYSSIHARFGDALLWDDDPKQVLRRCVSQPPSALVIDIPTGIRCDPQVRSRLHDLRLDLPVLRTQVRPGAAPQALCVEPVMHGDLDESLAAILAGDPAWHSAVYQRRSMRIPHQCRVTWRLPGQPHAQQSNTIDISAGGCFVVAYAPAPATTRVTLDFPDNSPVPCTGIVAWSRSWGPRGLIPGMGIALESDVAQHVFGDLLVAAADSAHWPPTMLPTNPNMSGRTR